MVALFWLVSGCRNARNTHGTTTTITARTTVNRTPNARWKSHRSQSCTTARPNPAIKAAAVIRTTMETGTRKIPMLFRTLQKNKWVHQTKTNSERSSKKSKDSWGYASWMHGRVVVGDWKKLETVLSSHTLSRHGEIGVLIRTLFSDTQLFLEVHVQLWFSLDYYWRTVRNGLSMALGYKFAALMARNCRRTRKSFNGEFKVYALFILRIYYAENLKAWPHRQTCLYKISHPFSSGPINSQLLNYDNKLGLDMSAFWSFRSASRLLQYLLITTCSGTASKAITHHQLA